jgi:hypothetical protein
MMGGLAVNASVEPVVSLDLDVVIVAEQVDGLLPILQSRYRVERCPPPITVADPSSDLRVQIQTDPRYQPFIARATLTDVLGYRLPVATMEDVLQGTMWAAMDETRRPSTRQKALADILRLIEAKSELRALLPRPLKEQLIGTSMGCQAVLRRT